MSQPLDHAKDLDAKLGLSPRQRSVYSGHDRTTKADKSWLLEDGIWKPVIRYDCAHDCAHRDRYNLKGDQDKQEIALSYAESLDFADKDINDNWAIYQQRFLSGDYP
jgi:hypothetical protein